MSIVGGLDIHRKQLTFDYLDTVSGQVSRGQVAPADREHLRAWLARFAGRGDDAAFAIEGCTVWRYVAGELTAAGIGVHLAEPADTAFARGRKRHAKTDKTDSRHLRQLLAAGRAVHAPPTRPLQIAGKPLSRHAGDRCQRKPPQQHDRASSGFIAGMRTCRPLTPAKPELCHRQTFTTH
jgi:hypothetical protein